VQENLKKVWREKEMNNRYTSFLYLLVFLTFHSLDTEAQAKRAREMRAVWVASVNNIDWPVSPLSSPDEQKKEAIKLLETFSEYNLNTIILQIRPAADAFYNSSIEPWSQWLTGTQGKGPEPYYDPLEFWITESRKRGFDIHAWVNPYRAITDTANETSPEHITNIHPEWFLTYGKTVYFDPGLPETRDYVSRVIGDIVRRYDVDAIHMDDYFYPYRIAKVEFPDDSSFIKYGGNYAPENRDDWRRENVNLIIRQLSDTIRSIKPWVEFGISPFGVWRNIEKDPGGSATKAGQTNYDDLFADILLWQKMGWIDYIVPQIYWHIGFQVADYSILADWWSRNASGCRLYIGQAPYRINKESVTKEWRSSKQIVRQVELNRQYPNISGSVYFSGKVFRNDPLNLRKRMLRSLYPQKALPPAGTRISQLAAGVPVNPVLVTSGDSLKLSWESGANTKNFIIYKFRKGKDSIIDDPENIYSVTSLTSLTISLGKRTDPDKYIYMICSQNRSNLLGEPVWFRQVK
jgi:uncharacterized lipoprotein YddW (UPF0748 family)